MEIKVFWMTIIKKISIVVLMLKIQNKKLNTVSIVQNSNLYFKMIKIKT
jgi:hypothetical protein